MGGTEKKSFDFYIASCVQEGGIYHYRLSDGGKVETVSFTPMDRPMYMTVANGKMYVLLCAPFEKEGSWESGLIVYDMDDQGRLCGGSRILSTKGVEACHLAVDGETVYAANYETGSVIQMPDRLVIHEGKGVHPERQEAPHTHFVSPTPEGKYICVTDLGIDKVKVYRKDMTLVSEVNLPAGHGPRHLAFHGDGKHVFCANELGSTVSLLKYQDGVMEEIQTVSTVPEGFREENTTAAIRCIGDRVCVSNRGHDSIAVFRFENERLMLERNVPVYGSAPRDFWIFGDLSVSTCQLSDEVTLVSLERGELIGKILLKTPICVIAKPVLS